MPSPPPDFNQWPSDELYPYRFYQNEFIPHFDLTDDLLDPQRETRIIVGDPTPDPFWGTSFIDALMVLGIPFGGFVSSICLIFAIRKQHKEEQARQAALRNGLKHNQQSVRY